MRMTLASIALISGIAFSLPSYAATVESEQGKLSINRGDGFQPVAGTTQASAGDAVMVTPNGSGKIIYSDGCSIPVVPGAVITITPESPCKSFAQATPSTQFPDPGPFVIGAVVVGAIGGIVAATSGRDGSPAPVSP